jgi:monoterpene epsilon-lactone hydrolase
MASPQLETITQMLREQRAREEDLDFAAARAVMDGTAAFFQTPDDVSREAVDCDGVGGEWIDAPGVDPETVVYYLHGGGYTIGSITSHRLLISRISRATGARALAVNYRLAPENPYPAGLEDALAGYRWLIATGIEPSRITIGGDSAGGGLTLATLLALRDAGDPLPAAAILISPWTDLTSSGESIESRAELDPMIDPSQAHRAVEAYIGSRDASDPLVSPVFADLSRLPPMLIQVGDHEVLLDDSTRLEANARAAGVDATLEVWDEMFHVWHFFASMLPEAQQAIDRIGAFVRQHIATRTAA